MTTEAIPFEVPRHSKDLDTTRLDTIAAGINEILKLGAYVDMIPVQDPDVAERVTGYIFLIER